MNDRPQTDHEWTIQSLNIHGSFFERWCRHVVRSSKAWSVVSSNYPVAYKPADSEWGWSEGELDLRAIHGGYQGRLQNRRHLTLLIECKKHNPKLSSWVFFPSDKRGLNHFPAVETNSSESHINDCAVTIKLLQASLDLPLVEVARETREKYVEESQRKTRDDLTKTSTEKIAKATHQIGLATQAILNEEESLLRHFGRFNPDKTSKTDLNVFLPVIVTTANLLVCEFEDKDINGVSGEIPFGNARLVAAPCVVYRARLSPRLQRRPDLSVKDALMYGSSEAYARMDVLVVNSGWFKEFLQKIPDMMSHVL